MKTAGVIFQKIFVRGFYVAHATFFLWVVGIAAGFMRAPEHMALAEFFISSPFLLLVPISAWLLYAFKVIRFNRETLTRAENEFLFQFVLLARGPQWLLTASVAASQCMPAIAYGFFLVAMAAKHKVYTSVALVLLALACLVLAIGWSLREVLRHPHSEKSVGRIKRLLDRSFARPFPLFFPEWIARRNFPLLASTKAFGCLLLLATAYLYTKEPYDARLLAMAVVAAMAAHTQLLWEMQQFDVVHFSILRQLPIAFARRVLYSGATVLLLMLPEYGILLRYFPSNLYSTQLASMVFFGISIPLLITGLLYTRDRTPDKLLSRVFLLSMALIVLVLFDVPLPVLGIVNATAGLVFWKRCYYGFEHISSP